MLRHAVGSFKCNRRPHTYNLLLKSKTSCWRQQYSSARPTRQLFSGRLDFKPPAIASVGLTSFSSPTPTTAFTLTDKSGLSSDNTRHATPSEIESASAEPSSHTLVRLFDRLLQFLDDYVLEPLLTLRRLLHILVLFTPVVLTTPAVFLGHQVTSEERSGTLWWYDFLSAQMERAGPTFIKVTYHNMVLTRPSHTHRLL